MGTNILLVCVYVDDQWLLFVALKFKVIHTILFLFFIITALVAFVLMETQKRMLTFTGADHLLFIIPGANMSTTID